MQAQVRGTLQSKGGWADAVLDIEEAVGTHFELLVHRVRARVRAGNGFPGPEVDRATVPRRGFGVGHGTHSGCAVAEDNPVVRSLVGGSRWGLWLLETATQEGGGPAKGDGPHQASHASGLLRHEAQRVAGSLAVDQEPGPIEREALCVYQGLEVTGFLVHHCFGATHERRAEWTELH